MANSPSATFLKRLLVTGSMAAAATAGLAFAPDTIAQPAWAQANRTAAVTPPGTPGSFADLISQVSPAVVSIDVRQRPGSTRRRVFERGGPDGDDFFGAPRPPSEGPTAEGSGFIIDPEGIIVTNHHVIDGAEQITVRLQDGRALEATLVGSDEATDLAVLRLQQAGRYPYVRFSEDNLLRVGDWVVAVGNPFGLSGTVTAGIVSALGRDNFSGSAYVDFLQISAPINSGNSGGPTFDMRGRVVGVNSMIFSPTGGNVGIGFAIPAETAQSVVSQLRERGQVTRGYLGVQVQPLDDDLARGLGLEASDGALVASVVAEGPAAQGGVRQGDVILSVDGQTVANSRDLTRRVGGYAVGRVARLEVWRDGRRQTLQVRLGERPGEEQLAQANGSLPDALPEDSSALGVQSRPATQAERDARSIEGPQIGLYVEALTPGTEAAERLRVGDIILRANNVRVRDARELGLVAEVARSANRPVQLLVAGEDGTTRLEFVAPAPQ